MTVVTNLMFVNPRAFEYLSHMDAAFDKAMKAKKSRKSGET